MHVGSGHGNNLKADLCLVPSSLFAFILILITESLPSNISNAGPNILFLDTPQVFDESLARSFSSHPFG